MRINTRLRKLELESMPSMQRGNRTFSTADCVLFFETTSAVFDNSAYLMALWCSDGNPPTGINAYTKAQLDAMETDGYTIMVTHWVKDWRAGDSGQSAVNADV